LRVGGKRQACRKKNTTANQMNARSAAIGGGDFFSNAWLDFALCVAHIFAFRQAELPWPFPGRHSYMENKKNELAIRSVRLHKNFRRRSIFGIWWVFNFNY
jgi:hypothetical protein